MAHKEQRKFCLKVKDAYPNSFKNIKVLDVGSMDINGNNRNLFENCIYFGLDVAPGNNVDIVCCAHEFADPDDSYDTIISTEAFEHDKYFSETLKNIIRLLKSGGLFLFTCATIGRAEHGTIDTDAGASATSRISGWEDFYQNRTEEEIRQIINIKEIFIEFSFFVNGTDLQFFGVKKCF